MGLADHWLKAAYEGASWLKLMRPLESLYVREVERRAAAWRNGRRHPWRAPVPVIVVGNITLGGTGKSPLVAWLGRHLVARGFRPGLLSRGYGGKAEYPLRVTADTRVVECGDEPRMLHDQTGLPVVVDPERARGARCLIEEGCNLIITDDGLQHHRLARDLEIVVVDGARGFGNGRCLPAGPLREPLGRLETVDAVIINGQPHHDVSPSILRSSNTFHMALEPSAWRRVSGDDGPHPLLPLPFSAPPFSPQVRAVAGIGNPQRFFATLDALGIEHQACPFGDHHRFVAEDLAVEDGRVVVMTAKDAVKCRDIAPPDCWALDVEAAPCKAFVAWLARQVAGWTAEAVPHTDPVEKSNG
ncbi:tetraacyldisaccharide 4'-kinase [Halomonas cupida]|uniref:Tetraacyldisaccharide 4'-kinase n=1 Tax=Halomonas cupida TaxID=44933 RepID=A0A1M7A363_9GAMM|nr:tetraacyldisaccharide 4'-kinase [Halomonas cupida]GEN22551.1 tetraacyldisaccharide 4'-kinase [Halomonas cupida]SHL37157.1 lipid-A-disaccharide kinase [Halomonas cupida]